jgi:hypothetical protein
MIKATAAGASTSGTVLANVLGTITSIRVVAGLIVTTNDILLVEQIGQEWWAVALAYDATPPAPPAPPPAAPPSRPPTIGKSVFSPVETRSYRSSVFVGWRTDTTSVYQGQYGGNGLHTGCAFYGTGPRSLKGATVTSASVQVRRLSGGTYAAQTTTLWLLVQATRPAGAPSRGSSTSGPRLAVGSTGTFTIPTSWAQGMVDGTAGGLAIFVSGSSPYVRLAGKGDWSPAFSMTINWRRG